MKFVAGGDLRIPEVSVVFELAVVGADDALSIDGGVQRVQNLDINTRSITHGRA